MLKASPTTVLAAFGAVVLAFCFALTAAAPASALSLNRDAVPSRTQVAVVYPDGTTTGTANSHESRPALSLAKLYLGYWVLREGSAEDAAKVYDMIRVSHDGIASELDARYPQAIPSIINEFALNDSAYPGYWGYTTTSVADVAGFVSRIRTDPIATPIIAGMRDAAPIANDGYAQNYGTAVLTGAQGTKFGWADDHSVHATVTLGEGWVIAANTYGSPADETSDVLSAVINEITPTTLSSGELLDRFGCLDSLGSAQFLPQTLQIPRDIAQFLPSC